MLTRKLWLGIGFHMAWNYTQQAIFSGVISGVTAHNGAYSVPRAAIGKKG